MKPWPSEEEVNLTWREVERERERNRGVSLFPSISPTHTHKHMHTHLRTRAHARTRTHARTHAPSLAPFIWRKSVDSVQRIWADQTESLSTDGRKINHQKIEFSLEDVFWVRSLPGWAISSGCCQQLATPFSLKVKWWIGLQPFKP